MSVFADLEDATEEKVIQILVILQCIFQKKNYQKGANMKQNPCRYCALAYVRNGRHSPSWDDKCRDCENIKEHKKYLESQRMFVEGEPITTLEELLKQELVMWYHQSKHIEAIISMQVRTVLKFIEVGAFRKAVRKESEEEIE